MGELPNQQILYNKIKTNVPCISDSAQDCEQRECLYRDQSIALQFDCRFCGRKSKKRVNGCLSAKRMNEYFIAGFKCKCGKLASQSFV